MGSVKPLNNILLVEDSEDDAMLLKRAFKRVGRPLQIDRACDGDQAVQMLMDRLKAPKTLPSLILLDIKMPRRGGHSVLAYIKEQPILRCIPTIILSSSSEDRDIYRAYRLGANSYLVKPVNLLQFNDICTSIDDYWFDRNRMLDMAKVGVLEDNRYSGNDTLAERLA